MRAFLSKDVTVMFRGDYPVTAKAGTFLKLIKGADGGKGDLWAIPAHACDAGNAGTAGTWSIFGHDSKHYHIWAPLDAIQLLDESEAQTLNYAEADATESFWEFLRGNIQIPQCVEEIRAAGLTIEPEEISAARMENRAAVATWQGKPVRLVQPW